MIPDFSTIPTRPGVYLLKGSKEQVLYVGKAKNLRSRLRTYFQGGNNLDLRKAAMVSLVRDYSYIVTDNELEALILEATFIKQHKPKFNIVLRDDKNYPYIKLSTAEEWPRLEVVRKIKRDGNLYFGPYVPAQGMWEALAFIRRNFLIRTCGYLLDKPMRACIQDQMKRCSAPCAGAITKEAYLKIVEDVRLFLIGDKKGLIERLEEKMNLLADEMRFEEAANVRNRIFKLRQAFQSQKVVSPELGDIDVLGFYRQATGTESDVAIHILFLRNGVLMGAKDFFIEKVLVFEDSEIMHSVIELFYSKEILPPATILTNVLPTDLESLLTLLRRKRGEDIVIEVPGEGKKLDLLTMANKNALIGFLARRKSSEEVLMAVKEKLKLQNIPLSFGAFDVSAIQGSEAVGAFVYWEGGDFKKDIYRRLKIKNVTGIDDYAMMKEIIERTLTGLEGLPVNLIVIDGGKGQLEIARKVVEQLGIKSELVGIAKRPDRAFLCSNEVVALNDRSRASLLLKQIRDEAHRFAISFHRKLRDKRLMESPLEKIRGIGKKRRLELLRSFGSIDGIQKATVQEIAQIKGFNIKTAERILEGIKSI